MAQINNHEFYGLDTDYVTKHKELFDFFDGQNLDVEINDDFAELKTILTSIFPRFSVWTRKRIKFRSSWRCLWSYSFNVR